MRVLLITPPMTQINTPYPATAYLTGFLRERGFDTVQADLSIEVALKLFTVSGLRSIQKECKEKKKTIELLSRSRRFFLTHFDEYEKTIEPVIHFLQGTDPTLAHRISSRNFLPEGPRFAAIGELTWAFGYLGIQDQAKHLCSLYIDDLADVIKDAVDPKFELSRYAEKLASSCPSFDPIQNQLNNKPTLIDQIIDDLSTELIQNNQPKVVGLSVPFPGNVYGAFRIAKKIKELAPEIKIILGGGYVNTELRELKDARVFNYIDYITLDDGEKPILCLLEQIKKGEEPKSFLRTFVKEESTVVFKTDPKWHDIPFKDTGTPVYDGLPLTKYLSLCEMLNPMHRLWSDGRWNKLTIAHGCYWKKCSFCDVSLDYIGRYENLSADILVDKIEKIVKETGQSGFHFVDEAAPPKSLEALALKLIERKINITWWANIRFEKTFTPELAKLLAQSGCIAMSGGLEVASNRLLKLMEKGVTVEQVAQVTHAFSQAGILVHSYLMFGFPTQTLQETIDAVERVRQLFSMNCIQSAFWHRFSVTVHSPVGKNPEAYGITLIPFESTFAKNDIAFTDPTGVDHDALHFGLKKAIYNYMHGMGFEDDIRNWFDFKTPKTTVPKDLIATAILKSNRALLK